MKPSPQRRSAARFLVPSLACLAAGPLSLSAQTFDWTNSSGGNYSTGANWTPAGPPGAGGTARFALPNTYSLTFSAPATVGILTQNQGDVTLFLNGWTFQPTSTSNNGMGASGQVSSLRISNGTFLPGNFSIAGNPGSTSTLLLDAGSATTVGSGAFHVGTSGNGTLIVQTGADLTTSASTGIGVNASATGSATVTGSGSTWTVNQTLRVGSNGQGTLQVLNGGSVTANALESGENHGSIGAVSVAGANSALTVAGTANIGGASDLFPANAGTLSIGPGATVNFNGTTNLRTHSTLLMSGGTLNLNTLNLTPGAQAAWTGGTIQFANASVLSTTLLDYLLAGSHTIGGGRTLTASAGTLALGIGLQVNGTLAVPDLTLNAPLKVGSFGTVEVGTASVESGKSLQIEDFGTFSPTDNAPGILSEETTRISLRTRYSWYDEPPSDPERIADNVPRWKTCLSNPPVRGLRNRRNPLGSCGEMDAALPSRRMGSRPLSPRSAGQSRLSGSGIETPDAATRGNLRCEAARSGGRSAWR